MAVRLSKAVKLFWYLVHDCKAGAGEMHCEFSAVPFEGPGIRRVNYQCLKLRHNQSKSKDVDVASSIHCHTFHVEISQFPDLEDQIVKWIVCGHECNAYIGQKVLVYLVPRVHKPSRNKLNLQASNRIGSGDRELWSIGKADKVWREALAIGENSVRAEWSLPDQDGKCVQAVQHTAGFFVDLLAASQYCRAKG